MISRSTDVGAALRARQRGYYLLNPYSFGAGGGSGDVMLLVTPVDSVGSTTFTDSSSHAWTLTTATGPAVANDLAPPFGPNKEVKFSSRAGSVGVGGTGADWKFLHDGSKWTFECWYQADDFSAQTTFLDTAGATTANVGVYLGLTDSPQKVVLQIYYASVGNYILQALFSTPGFPNDTASYHFVQVTCDLSLGSNNAECWVDGVSQGVASKTGATSSADSTYAARLFDFNGAGGLAPKGRFFDVRITKDFCRPNVVPSARLTP